MKEQIPAVAAAADILQHGPGGNVDRHLVSLTGAATPEREQYSLLCCTLEQARREKAVSAIGITSATAGDGKTTTAINLAGALAFSAETRVLLIDADLRRSSVAQRLGLAPSRSPGLVETITDPALALKDVILRPSSFNVAVVTAGRLGDASPCDLFRSPRMGALLAEARSLYDYIVLDTAPTVPAPDCRVLEPWIDGFVVVVAADKTPRRALAEALTVLSPQKCLGLVFNAVDHHYYYSPR